MREELLPCPFCGGVAGTAGIDEDAKVAFCCNEKCNLNMHGWPIPFWNTRHLPASVTAVIEAVRAIILKMPQVHLDSQYVWVLAHQHTGEYKGATYEKELNDLIDTIINHDKGRK